MLASSIDGSTPIHYAASKGHANILELFLKEAPAYGLSAKSILSCMDDEKQLPLHRAAHGGYVEVAVTIFQFVM